MSFQAAQVYLRRPPKRILVAVGTIFYVLFLLRYNRESIPGIRSSKLINDVYNRTLGFEKIFIVSLSERSDRRDAVALSAALTGIDVEFVDAVRGAIVKDKVIPNNKPQERLPDAAVGCWRSHMNILRTIIQSNLTSVLILEDDVDWDVRIKDLLHDFASATNALTQPLQSQTKGMYADPSFPWPEIEGNHGQTTEFLHDDLPKTIPPTLSPYGDNWDMLWVGHCIMGFIDDTDVWVPHGRVVHYNDSSVPESQYLTYQLGNNNLRGRFPHHTRVVHHVGAGLCSTGYAITQQGAQRLLKRVGLENANLPYDLLLREFCNGNRGHQTCLTVQPQLFEQHRRIGPFDSDTDIQKTQDKFRTVPQTNMLRWSTIMNWEALFAGRNDFVDQYPDGGEYVPD